MTTADVVVLAPGLVAVCVVAYGLGKFYRRSRENKQRLAAREEKRDRFLLFLDECEDLGLSTLDDGWKVIAVRYFAEHAWMGIQELPRGRAEQNHSPMIHLTIFPPRCWIFGRRWHHALTGFVLLLAPHALARLLGSLLILSDLRDRRVWIADFVRTTN